MLEIFVINLVVFLCLVFSVLILVEDLYFYFKIDEDSRWSKLLYAAVGFSWTIRFILYYLRIEPFDKASSNPTLLIFLTFTLLSMVVGANIRIQREIGIKGIVEDLKRVYRWISLKF